ncbi:MAG: MBOAT family O-acyltransferase, partial [Ferruginibacter sp.]
IREFWKRWHVSLSGWFRDYVYIPLGGNRRGFARKNMNLLITFVLSGFWHGAGWTYLLWGFLHGIYTLIYEGFKHFFVSVKVPNVLAWLLTCFCVGFAYIFFRAGSLSIAMEIIARGFQFSNFSLTNLVNLPGSTLVFGNFSLAFSFSTIIYMLLIEKYTTPKLFDLNSKEIKDVSIFVSALLLIIFFGVFQKSSFIYFQF